MSHGMLTVGGIISLIMGSLLLFDTPEPALSCLYRYWFRPFWCFRFLCVVIWLAIKAQLRKHYTGAESMIGSEAEVVSDISDEGKVFLKGAYWKAISKESVKKGAKVRVY